MIRVCFEIANDYYWAGMEPLYRVLSKDPNYDLWLKIGPNQKRFLGIFLISRKQEIEAGYIKQGYKTTDSNDGFDIVVVGDTIKKPQRYGNAMLLDVEHSICIKTQRYRSLLKQPETQYVTVLEGDYREKKFQEYGLDKKEIIIKTGMPKMDPFYNGWYKREDIIKKHNLDPNKKIVLYGPSYKPTSIYALAEYFPQLNDYNVIIKLHPYSWAGKYAPHAQHKIFEKLAAKHKNIILVPQGDNDIMPYLFAADTMISEASATINEFLALERSGIIFDLNFDSLKHSDGEPLMAEDTEQWLKDSFVHIKHGKELKAAVDEAVNPSPERKKAIQQDANYIFKYRDGKSSQRVKAEVERLLREKGKL